MRRTVLIVIATAVVTSSLTSFTVAAATGGPERRAAEGGPGSPRGTGLPVIVDTDVDCGTPAGGRPWPSRAALERSVRCLEQEVVNVNRFMKAFFRCTRIFPVTRYGDDPAGGTFGYLWRAGGDEFLTTALDYTVDPSVETFQYFAIWRATTFCTT